MRPSVSEQNVVRARFENDSQRPKSFRKCPRIDFEWVPTIIHPKLASWLILPPKVSRFIQCA